MRRVKARSTKLLPFRVRLALALRKVRPIELGQALKVLTGVTYGEHSVNGMTVWLDPASNLGVGVLNGSYEPAITQVLQSILSEGDTFIDVGANEGWFSLLASKAVGETGMVLGVEPQARLWEILIRNLVLNDCHNCRLVPYAVGSTESEVDLILHPWINNGATTLVASNRRRHFRRQKARMLRLDTIARMYSDGRRIKLVKIDCEGYELEAVKGASHLLHSRLIQNLLIEYHPDQLRRLGQSKDDIGSYLGKYGYTSKMIHGVEVWSAQGFPGSAVAKV
jgi:FkbM family methyltransferase